MEYVAGSLALDRNVAAQEIGAFLDAHLSALEGQIGYRQPSVGVRDKAEVPSFIIMSPYYGVVLIDVVDEKIRCPDETLEYFETYNREFLLSRDVITDNFYHEVLARIKKDSRLYDRKREKLYVPVRKLVVFYRNTEEEVAEFAETLVCQFVANDGILEKIAGCLQEWMLHPSLVSDLIDICIATVEGTAVYDNRRKRGPIIDPETKNDFIKLSLNTTFKLDQTQRRVAMQVPDGPQRIRGLAGTGKTVILSLKAALAHKDFPDFKILFLFNTQSMYRQIENLISEYYIGETKQQPNWANLHVFHAWGGRQQPGLYSTICNEYGLRPTTFNEVMGHSDALGAIYRSLLNSHSAAIRPTYDLILIDEAQDFSSPIFEMAFLLAKEPKRIVWAYDEFQSMTDIRMPPPDELFGKGGDGQPNIPASALDGEYLGRIPKDFILPNSYRNPRRTLVSAHGLALGLGRVGGVIDMIEQRRDWEALGYKVIQPEDKAKYEAGDEIVLERPVENSRNILETLLRSHHRDDGELIQCASFSDKESEMEAICSSICELVNKEGVDPHEIIVVSLRSGTTTKNFFGKIRARLHENGIPSIMPGFIEKASAFKETGMVTLATPFRAKGNEANIVFVSGTEVVPGDATFRSRNALFVAMTRSRGWTYVSGVGEQAVAINDEIGRVLGQYPRVSFQCPNEADLNRRRVILAKDDIDVIKKQNLIQELMASDPELLIELIKGDAELMQQIYNDQNSKN